LTKFTVTGVPPDSPAPRRAAPFAPAFLFYCGAGCRPAARPAGKLI
jgi:hypothetical protein